MICLQCGYCCTRLLVVIAKDINKPLSKDNFMIFSGGEKSNSRCPHLRGSKPGEYSCICHDKPWFKDSPCAQYQSHWPEQKCKMGMFLIQNKK